MFNKRTKTAGNTIIEILIATVIVALILTALAAAMTRSVYNSSEAEYRQTAARLGQDVMEVFRQDKESNPWQTFYGFLADSGINSFYCVPMTLTTVSQITQTVSDMKNCSQSVTANNMIFHRVVTKTSVGSPPTSVKITVTVAWNAADPARKRTVDLQQIFYKPN